MNVFETRIKLFNNLVKELYKCEMDYLKGIQKYKQIIKTLFPSNQQDPKNNLFTKQFEIFQNYIINKNNNLQREIDSFEKDILIPLDKFRFFLYSNIHKKQISEIEKKILLSKQKISTAREKYIASLKKVEDSLLTFQNSLNSHIPFELIKAKAKSNIEDGKQLEKEYENAIKEGNVIINEYFDLVKKSEEIWNKYFCLENDLLLKINFLFSLRTNEELGKLKDDLFCLGNEKMKIINNSIFSNILRSEQKRLTFQFIPYVPLLLNKSTDVNNNYVIGELKKNFKLNNIVEPKAKENNDDNFIALMENFAVESKSFSHSEVGQLENYLKEKSYRTKFIFKINQLRSKGTVFNKEHEFKILCDCFNFILEQVAFDYMDEIENVKICLLLSQTLYKEKEGKKVYIEEFIKNNLLLTNGKLWKELIEKELKEQNMTDNLSQDRIFVILPYFKNLIEFVKDKDKINEVLTYFQEKYNIDKGEIESLIGEIANDTANESKNKKDNIKKE